MNVEWRGYTYHVCFDGTHYVAIDWTKGHDKRRLNFKCWHNIHDGTPANPELTTELEAAVSRLQSQTATRKYGPVNGTHNGGAPLAQRVKGKFTQLSNREPKRSAE